MPAGRPRKFDETAVLDAAVRLFRRDGFARASVAALCRETGLATQSLYNTFGDKAALYQRAMDHYGQCANGPIIDELIATPDPIEALRTFIKNWKRHRGATADYGCLCTQALASAADDGPGAEACTARRYTIRLRDALRARAKQAHDNGQLLPDVNPIALADSLLTTAFGIAVIGRGGLPATMIAHAIAQALSSLAA